MTQTTAIENNKSGYFTLNHLKPQPTTTPISTTANNTKSGLLNRRQQQAAAAYLPQLELPSLPPLSQLLTTDNNNNNNNKVKKENTNPSVTATSTQDAVAAAAAVAVANGMMPNMNYTTAPPPLPPVQGQHIFYNATNTTNNVSAPPSDFVTNGTTNMAQLMDPNNIHQLVDTTVYNTTDPAIAAAMMGGYPQASVPPSAITHPLRLQQNHYHHHPQAKQNNDINRQRQLSNSSISSAEKIYSFVAIPGTNQKKRPRRRYDEIERLYHCNFPGCTKAYGTLNHLNAHVSMQKHGAKRHPAEFKEMRKEWRRQKKEREAHKKAIHEQQQQQQQQNNMIHQQPSIPSNTMMSYQPNHPFQQPPFSSANQQQHMSNGTTTAPTMTLNGFY